jgi:hypothetical protein
MLSVFYSQKTERLIKKLEITQWRIRLQEKVNLDHHTSLSTIEKIEKLPAIWKD